jgi:DNA-binding transcriptional LysR family regulator
MPNLTHPTLLASVARHVSVTEAAKELHYSSHRSATHLGGLEAATGAKLIQRVVRGIRLTPKGNYWRNRRQRSWGD